MSYDEEITDSGLGIVSMLDESMSDEEETGEPGEPSEPLEGSDDFGYEEDSDFDKDH